MIRSLYFYFNKLAIVSSNFLIFFIFSIFFVFFISSCQSDDSKSGIKELAAKYKRIGFFKDKDQPVNKPTRSLKKSSTNLYSSLYSDSDTSGEADTDIDIDSDSDSSIDVKSDSDSSLVLTKSKRSTKDNLAELNSKTVKTNQKENPDIYSEHEKDFLSSINKTRSSSNLDSSKISKNSSQNNKKSLLLHSNNQPEKNPKKADTLTQSSLSESSSDLSNLKLTGKEKRCVKVLRRYQPSYKNLEKFITTSSNSSHIPQLVSNFLSLKPSDCHVKYKQVILTMKKLLVENTGKVGVVLPLTGKYEQSGKNILEGIRAYYKNIKKPFNLSLKDSGSNILSTQKAIAELILQNRVSLLIVDEKQKESVSDLISGLNIPVLLLNPYSSGIKLSNHIFYVYPSQEQLVSTLTDKIVRSGIKRVALLKPNSSDSLNFSNLLSDSLKKQGILISHEELYSSSNYETMEWASKSIFQIDPMKRASEYAMLLDQSKQKAQLEGVGFNPSSVVLPAIKDFDAVIIPDNFKIVRHFSKIFKYLGVNKIPLIGTYEWRSFDLIHPYDPTLEGSFFVDFIGKYTDLPRSLNFALEKDSSYFIDPSSVSRIDHEIIGYRSMDITDKALSKRFKKRSALIRYLRTMNSSDSSYFNPGPVFNTNQVALWPSFILNISNGGIREEQSAN